MVVIELELAYNQIGVSWVDMDSTPEFDGPKNSVSGMRCESKFLHLNVWGHVLDNNLPGESLVLGRQDFP